jgi:hypothetical protein
LYFLFAPEIILGNVQWGLISLFKYEQLKGSDYKKFDMDIERKNCYLDDFKIIKTLGAGYHAQYIYV